MKVKLCGFKEEESLKTAIKMQADFIGFIFHENSPRYISPKKAGEIAKIIPHHIAKVAVVVGTDQEKLEEISHELQPQYFQLHGQETVEDVKKIKQAFPLIKIIKAFKIGDLEAQNFEPLSEYQDICDFFMLDNNVAGSGESWDFSLLEGVKINKEWFLSGGLKIDNVLEAIRVSGAKMIDISSGIEKERGVKSSDLIIEFMQKVKNIT